MIPQLPFSTTSSPPRNTESAAAQSGAEHNVPSAPRKRRRHSESTSDLQASSSFPILENHSPRIRRPSYKRMRRFSPTATDGNEADTESTRKRAPKSYSAPFPPFVPLQSSFGRIMNQGEMRHPANYCPPPPTTPASTSLLEFRFPKPRPNAFDLADALEKIDLSPRVIVAGRGVFGDGLSDADDEKDTMDEDETDAEEILFTPRNKQRVAA